MSSACVHPVGAVSHGSLAGLLNDDHSQYPLLEGRSGGQEIVGGDGSGERLDLGSTAHATKGGVRLLAGEWLEVPEVSAPATPSSGFGRVYEKSDGKLYFKNDAGTEYDLTTGISTHDLLSATHPDTLPSAVSVGGLIIGNATPKWAQLGMSGASAAAFLSAKTGIPSWSTIAALTADASPDGAADYVMTWDQSATSHKKVLLNNLPTTTGPLVVSGGVISKNTDTDQIVLEATGTDEVQLGLSRGAPTTVQNIVEVYEEDGSTLLAVVAGDGSLATVGQVQLGGTIGSPDVLLGSGGSGVLTLGEDASSPVDQSIKAPGGLGTNRPGADATMAAGPGTGTGAGGNAVIQTAPPGSTGSTPNAMVDRVTVADEASIVYIGNGETNTTPIDGTVTGTGGSGTNKAGGDLFLSGGRPTGSADGGDVHVQAADGGASGTTPRANTDRLFIRAGGLTLVDGADTDAFTLTVNALGMLGGKIFYSVRATDGVDVQVVSGVVTFAVVNKAAVLTTDIDDPAQVSALSAGTLSVVWSIGGLAPSPVFKVNANSSLSGPTIDVFFQVVVNGSSNVT